MFSMKKHFIFDAQDLREKLEKINHSPEKLINLLHDIQKHYNHIPSELVPLIAEDLHLSRAEVHGVITFYHEFRTSPAGRHIVQICRAEACQAMGSRQLEAHAKKFLGIEFGQTSTDGNITLEPVYCLGNCTCSPSVRIDDQVYARIDSAHFDQLIANLDGTVGGQ